MREPLGVPCRRFHFVLAGESVRTADEHRGRLLSLIITVLVCLSAFAGAAAAGGDAGGGGTSRAGLRPFLETGLFIGGQTDALIWAQGNARADASLIYVEGGLEREWNRLSTRPGHRVGIAVSIDMGGESGWGPALGLGPRLTYSLDRNWALQGQVGLLGGRGGTEESSNSLGSEDYDFKGGHQARIGVLYRNKVSVVAMWRVLDYQAELRSYRNPQAPDRSKGKAHLFCLGVMLHGRIGTYASLGSCVVMCVATALGSLASSGA